MKPSKAKKGMYSLKRPIYSPIMLKNIAREKIKAIIELLAINRIENRNREAAWSGEELKTIEF